MSTGTGSAADLISGVAAIAAELNMSRPQAQHLINRGALPVFRLYDGARTLFADRVALRQWLADRAAGARHNAA